MHETRILTVGACSCERLGSGSSRMNSDEAAGLNLDSDGVAGAIGWIQRCGSNTLRAQLGTAVEQECRWAMVS